jgi:hypothetical protein
VWRFLGDHLPQGVPVPEAATQLILAGKSEDRLGKEGFQRAVYARQQELEAEAMKRGLLLLCDRGLLDGLAYLPSLFTDLEFSREEVLSRYGMVIQLEVIQDSRAYDLHFSTNPARHEIHAAALALEKSLSMIYEKHPAYVFLTGSLEEKKRTSLRLLRERLAAVRPDLEAKPNDQA